MDWNNLYLNYDGRCNRKPYWLGSFVLGLIQIAVVLLIALILGMAYDSSSFNALEGVMSLVFLYPALAVTTKRWHDRDKSGWWSLILFVPIIGAIWMLVECGVLRGTMGPNRFGPDPLAKV